MSGVSISLHHIFPLGAICEMLDDLIDSIFLFPTSIIYVLPQLIVAFSGVSDRHF